MSHHDEDLKELLRLLQEWAAGQKRKQDVHEWAESWSSSHEWCELPERDPRSKLVEVISRLEILDHELVTAEDIPAILSFLEAPQSRTKGAWESWRKYWNGIDYQARAEELRKDPYYVTELIPKKQS